MPRHHRLRSATCSQKGRPIDGSAGQLRRDRRLTLAEEAYEAIVEAIIDRRLLPGARLLIRSLAADLEMSTTPVREALSRAAAQRLVLQVTNQGCRVAPLLDRSGFNHVFEVRRLLEEHAARSSSPDETSISRMRDLADHMAHMGHGDHYRVFQDFNEADREFHFTLVQMARNPFLDRAWMELHFHLHVGRLYTGSGVIDFTEALEEHAGIADALVNADLITAANLTVDHIRNSQRRLRSLVVDPVVPDDSS